MRLRPLIFLLLLTAPSIAFAQLGDLVSPGELSKAHEKLAGIKNCNACHGSNREVLESKCLECHKDMAARIKEKKGFHADKTTGCMSCHSEHLGRDFDIRSFDVATFNHNQTGFPLTGLHAKVKDCAACHKTRSFLGLSTSCASCHKDPHKGNLPGCESCHSTDRPMKSVQFDHAATRYPLAGSHTNVSCVSCHKNQVFRGLSFVNCDSCHKDPHKGALGKNCSQCHNEERWKAVKVQHVKFPLLGKHTAVACEKCHPSGKWKLTNFAKCADCHRDPHLGQFKQQECESCHNVNAFKPAKFNHDRFKLEAGHAVDCARCHKKEKGVFPTGRGEAVRFKPVRQDCLACHKDVHNGQLGVRCESCHNTTSFRLNIFDHSKTRYPLDAVHRDVACAKCHKKDEKTGLIRYKPLETACSACHKDPHLGQVGSDCVRCHKPEGLRFDHATSRFPLDGKHVPVACEKCHRVEEGVFPAGKGKAIRYAPISQTCATCHADYHRGQFKKDCAECHNTQSFRPAIFKHAKSDYPLTGAHAAVQCERCHRIERFETPPPPADLVRYRPVSRSCAACHKDVHQGRFGSDCARCHETQQWKTVSRGFHKTGKFALTGRHLSVACEACHLKGVMEGTPTRCYDCHWIRRQDDRYRTRLGNECEKCHSTSSWTGAKWDHASMAGVGLSSGHRLLSCDACHVQQSFTPQEVNCYSCHVEDYQEALQPNHVAGGFPTNCENCHSVSDETWSAIPLNHNQVFPLVGVHASQSCNACHRNNVYQGTPRTCVGCHKPDYDRTQSPNHARAGFPTDCEACHRATDSNWNQAGLDHNQFFPLVGLHANQTCNACHQNGVYKGTPRNCVGCHRDDYDRTQNPNHVRSGFSTNCESCHRPTDTGWGSGFNHSAVFPLVGSHAQQSCNACHQNGVYQGTPRDCVGCHRQDYDQTQQPNHRAAGFPTNCQNCHRATDASWGTGNFNHSNFFPLVGSHANQVCAACHPGGKYAGTPRDCYGCHRSDYDQTKDPNHRTAGFPTACESCHKASDANWNQAKFSHTSFPLIGSHATQPCAACHINGKYKGTPRDCYGCHRPEYDQTKNPNHRAAGFPTSCDACHRASDSSWNQGKFDHVWFPIRSGNHSGFDCVQCHNNPSNYQVFTCLTCHSRGETDPDHDEVSGYRYDSVACYHCHPNGNAD